MDWAGEQLMRKRFRRDHTIAALTLCLASAVSTAVPVLAESVPLAFVQVPKTSTPATSGIERSILSSRYRSGMRVMVADMGDVAGTMRNLTEGFATATDPSYRHDGSSLAFVGQRVAGDPLSIWESSELDPQPRKRVDADTDCAGPAYLPDGSIVFASFLAGEYEEHGLLRSVSLFSVSPGSNAPTRLSFNPSSEFDPTILPDGRVLYSSWQHVGNHYWPRGNMALLLCNSDGTGVFPFTGNHRGPWRKRGAQYIGKDEIAFIASSAGPAQKDAADFGAGSLLAVSLNDPFGSYRTLVSADQYEVADLAVLPDGRLILSARPAGAGQRSSLPSGTFGLYLFDKGELSVLFDDPNDHELSPAVGGRREPPEFRISTVVPDTPYGYLGILDCYETDRTDRPAMRPGSISAVRVIEGLPPVYTGGEVAYVQAEGGADEPFVHPASATGYIPSRILGEVPPAEDGSVYLKVPADRPLRIQLIDQNGFAAMNQRAWFWVRPNERRICIGCHENRELSPPNRAPLAMRRAPTDLTIPELWRTVSFRQQIQPIVKRTCAVTDCHLPPVPTAGMNLITDSLDVVSNRPLADRYGSAYANLVARQKNKPYSVGGRRIHPGNARSSPLLWMLYGRALGPQYTPAPFERPLVDAHPGPMLPSAQLELFRTWVDLGALYDDKIPPGLWPYEFAEGEAIAMEPKRDDEKDN